MPILKSAIKRAKQARVRRERNIETKRAMKAAIKEFRAQPSAKTLSAAQGAIDTAVKKNILEKNTAARRKSQLAAEAKAAGVKLTKKAAAPAAKAADKPAAKPVAKTTVAKKPAAKAAPAKKAVAKTTTAKAAPKKPAAKKAS